LTSALRMIAEYSDDVFWMSSLPASLDPLTPGPSPARGEGRRTSMLVSGPSQ